MLTPEAVRAINEILSRGGSVEIRQRRGSIVVIEIKGKVKYTITLDEE